jgi:hypothetical protein
MTVRMNGRMTVPVTAAKTALTAICAASLVFLSACGGGTDPGKLIKRLPVDSSAEVIAKKSVSTDSGISVDGNGSLKIDVTGTQTLPLYKFGDIDLENAFLVYQASLRTENLEGETFLEMICHFNGKGQFYSRNHDSPLSGTNGWTVRSTPFKLREGENPDMVELNIYVTGRGTVWIDDIKILQRPLN